MSDKYYSYVKDTSKNPYRATIDEVVAENFDTSDYIYNRGAITSHLIQPIDDLFVLTIPQNTLKNANENVYVNELEITQNDKYVRLSDENSEVYDIVMAIPHKINIKIQSSVPLSDSWVSARITVTNNNSVVNDVQYNTQQIALALTEQDENSYTYTATINGICSLHEFKLTLDGEYATNFESATLTITNAKMNTIRLPLSRDFTIEPIDYYYNGECLSITSNLNTLVSFDQTTNELTILHNATNFTTYNKERKIVFRNLPK